MHRTIRAWLQRRTPPATRATVLYGGSVSPANAAALLAEEEIDGFLVGGASLEAESWLKILETDEAGSVDPPPAPPRYISPRMYTFFLILLILDAFVLAAAVLLQSGQGGGLAASFGGASSTDAFVGNRQAATLLTKASWWGGGIFLGPLLRPLDAVVAQRAAALGLRAAADPGSSAGSAGAAAARERGAQPDAGADAAGGHVQDPGPLRQ